MKSIINNKMASNIFDKFDTPLGSEKTLIKPFSLKNYSKIERFCKKKVFSRSHKEVNAYIQKELLNNKSLYFDHEGEWRFVSIRGLWSHMGQFGHIGLRRSVSYIDEAFFYHPKVRQHEITELKLWKKYREGLTITTAFINRLKVLLEYEVLTGSLTPWERFSIIEKFECSRGLTLRSDMMRWWIKVRYEKAIKVAAYIHSQANIVGSVEELQAEAFSQGIFPVCHFNPISERDVNIAAGHLDPRLWNNTHSTEIDLEEEDDEMMTKTSTVLQSGTNPNLSNIGYRNLLNPAQMAQKGDSLLQEPPLDNSLLTINDDDLDAEMDEDDMLFDGINEVDIGYTTLNLEDGLVVDKEKVTKNQHLKTILRSNNLYNDILDIVHKMGRVKGKSIGVALGFYSNEQLFFWIETLARLRLTQDLADFVPDVVKQGEQSRAFFSEGKDYGIKSIYKEHRNQSPGTTFRSFELAHKRLSGLITPMFIGGFKSDKEKNNGGAVVEKITFLATNEYVLHRGHHFIDDLLNFFRKMWSIGVFDGDLFGLGGNKPGLNQEGHFLVLDFGSVKDTIQDKLFETNVSLGDDPFHMAIDKLHVTRDKLHEMDTQLSDYFENGLIRRYRINLFPIGEWQKGRGGSRGYSKAIPLAKHLKKVVKTHRPLKAPMEHYVSPFVGEPINSFIADKIRKRREYEKNKPLKQWAEDESQKERILKEEFSSSIEAIDFLISAEEIGLATLWNAYRLSSLEESLSLLREPFFLNSFKKVISDFRSEDLIGSNNLKKSFLNDFNQTVLALLFMASNDIFKSTFVYLSQPEFFGRTTLVKSFRWEPIKFCQSFERIVSLWSEEINGTMALVSENYSTLKEKWELLLEFDPYQGNTIIKKSFEYDSLKLTRILMEISKDYNVVRSFNFLKDFLGLKTLRALYQKDFFAFFEVLNMPVESREALKKRLLFIKDELFSLEAIRTAFVEEPLFFISTIPFLLEDWRREIKKGYKTEEGTIDINRFLEKHESKLIFVNSNVAGLNSTKGLSDIWKLKLSNYEVGLRNQMRESKDLVKERFPDQTTTEDIQASKGRVIIRYLNEVDFPISRFPHEPFKLFLPSKTQDGAREKLREKMNLGNRKLIIVSSPLPKEVEIVTNALKEIPLSERPLVIMGMRDADTTLKDKLINRGFKVISREDRKESMHSFIDQEVIVLNTRGELLDLLSAADLSIVGMDRNLFEPASQEVPILYFNGSWQNNLSQLKLLSGLKGVEVIEPSSLHKQMTYMMENRLHITSGIKAAIQKFETNVIPAANLIGSLAITNMIIKNQRISLPSKEKEDGIIENVIPDWSE